MDVSLRNIFNLIFKVKILFAQSISLKMFCKKGLPQIWTKSLKDISIVISFCLDKKPAALLRINSLTCFFLEDFGKIFFKLFFSFWDIQKSVCFFVFCFIYRAALIINTGFLRKFIFLNERLKNFVKVK